MGGRAQRAPVVAVDPEGHDQGDGQIQQRGHGEGLEPVEGMGLDLSGHVGEVHDADGHDQRRILDEVQELGNERRHHDAEGLGQNDVTHGLDKGQAAGPGGFELVFGDGEDAGAQILGDEGRRVDGEGDYAAGEFEILSGEPVVHELGQDGVGAEIPEEELNEQRRVAEKFRVGGGQPDQRPDPGQPGHGHRGAEHERGHDGNAGNLEGGDEPLHEPLPVLAGDDLGEIELVGHGTPRAADKRGWGKGAAERPAAPTGRRPTARVPSSRSGADNPWCPCRTICCRSAGIRPFPTCP